MDRHAPNRGESRSACRRAWQVRGATRAMGAVLLLLLAAFACSDGARELPDAGLDAAPDTEPVAPICTGGDDLRLAFRVVTSADRVEPGQQVQYDNGASYLFLDASCRYFVMTT